MEAENVIHPERKMVTCRIGAAGVDWMDSVALEETGRLTTSSVNRSDVLRTALLVARQHDREFRTLLRKGKS
jgi:hypothetical protein